MTNDAAYEVMCAGGLEGDGGGAGVVGADGVPDGARAIVGGLYFINCMTTWILEH